MTQLYVPTRRPLQALAPFLPRRQALCIAGLLMGEEGEWYRQRLNEIAAVIQAMPETYGQDGLGDQAIVHLHYFSGCGDWWITEKDAGSPDDGPEDAQSQAFGLADLGYGAELGYISIAELRTSGRVELDLHWQPKTLAEIKASRS